MEKQPVGQLPDLTQSNNDDEIMVITNSEYSQLKKEKISDLITDFTSTNENNALTKGTDGKMFVTDFGNASNITEGTLPVSVLPDIPKDLLPAIETTDLPASGVAANTYTYPSSVTVNAQGQVTAIEEGTPSGANANTDLSNITDAGKEVIKENSKSGTGLEIGDIGIAAFGIDESKGLRRYLNGSTLSVNQNTQAFVDKLKAAVVSYPSLACTETQWQAIAASSVGGQCGKFVINYASDGTTVTSIRLPKIIMPIQGLTDLTKLGELVEAGLPNITGSLAQDILSYQIGASGALSVDALGSDGAQGSSSYGRWGTWSFDASRSSDIYGNSDTVQQEQIQYPYFIQIATGVEYEVNIVNDIELNNPYTLFDSKYTETQLYNTSWLLSNGNFYAKSVYVSAYEALVVENNSEVSAGTSVQLPSGTNYVKRGLSVKLSTDEDITDYDFVINTTNETFKLPLKTHLASGNAVVGNGMTLGVTNGTQNAGIREAGSSNLGARLEFYGKTLPYVSNSGTNITNYSAIGITTDPTKSGIELSTSGLMLYFYVGETVQNANLINIGRFEENKANVNADNFSAVGKSNITGFAMPGNKSINLTLGESGATYTAPANGWFVLNKTAGRSGEFIGMNTDAEGNSGVISMSRALGAFPIQVSCPIAKGEKLLLMYSASGETMGFYFVYAQGEEVEE